VTSSPQRPGFVLDTPRLVLREMAAEDRPFVAEMLADPDVTRYYERQFDADDVRAWMNRQQRCYAEDGHGLWLVVERDSGEPVGQVGLMMQEVEGVRRPEVGWLLHRPFWGRGYATEAGAATRDAAFTRWGYAQVISLIRPANEPSRRVAERIGMAPGSRVHFHGFEHIVYEVSRAAVRPEPDASP
jgi:RimJ/RimL family protein N-acetyltransferase